MNKITTESNKVCFVSNIISCVCKNIWLHTWLIIDEQLWWDQSDKAQRKITTYNNKVYYSFCISEYRMLSALYKMFWLLGKMPKIGFKMAQKQMSVLHFNQSIFEPIDEETDLDANAAGSRRKLLIRNHQVIQKCSTAIWSKHLSHHSFYLTSFTC